MYTEFIETASLSAYARLCSLRLDPHAQAEIQAYARVVCDLLKEKFPVSWEALSPSISSGSIE
jgi:thymidylate synthase (FAD)